ncbi:MAG: hypothetical protein AB8C02_14945 [Halioglobus sp.]
MKYSIGNNYNTKLAAKIGLSLAMTAVITACGGGSNNNGEAIIDEEIVTPAPPPPPAQPAPVVRNVILGNDSNSIASPLLSLNPQGPGGSPNQSLRAGDVLQGGDTPDVIIGGLGVDFLLGGAGNDVLVGGTEDFNSNVDGDERGADNRDRAFGGEGSDAFIWAPGDGSDFFDGGPGVDAVIFAVVGEQRDSDGSTDGAPFFNVNPPNRDGSQDFDGIFLDATTNLPLARASNSPGFCTVLDDSTNQAELDTLGLDHLVRFSLRGIANAFDAGDQTEDDGLRVAISLVNTEFLVCTKRDFVEDGGVDNIQVLDLTTTPPQVAAIEDLPEAIQELLQ